MNRRPNITNEYLKLYYSCKEFNCLPYEGGLLDQPAVIAEAFFVIQNVINQYQAQKGGNSDG